MAFKYKVGDKVIIKSLAFSGQRGLENCTGIITEIDKRNTNDKIPYKVRIESPGVSDEWFGARNLEKELSLNELLSELDLKIETMERRLGYASESI